MSPTARVLPIPYFLFKGSLVDPQVRATFSPAHPPTRRDVPSAHSYSLFHFNAQPSKGVRSFNCGRRARPFLSFNFSRGDRQTVLHCAHRATTALSWGLCEQEGWLPAPSYYRKRRAICYV